MGGPLCDVPPGGQIQEERRIVVEFEEMLDQKAAQQASEGKTIRPYDKARAPKQFDTRAILADLKVLQEKATDLVNQANAVEIKTQKEKEEAVTISGKLNELAKAVENKCRNFVAPYQKVINAVNGPRKTITEAAKKAKKIVNQKIFQFKKQEEIDRAKQQKIIDEQSKVLEKKLKAQADELEIEAPKVTPIKAPKASKIERSFSGASVYTRASWKCEIVDADKVPMALLDKDGKERFRLCLPSQKLLNQAVKMGERNIPGCRIWQDETPVTRSG